MLCVSILCIYTEMLTAGKRMTCELLNTAVTVHSGGSWLHMKVYNVE